MMENRSGKYTTNLQGEMAYKSFVPNPLPPNPSIKIDSEMMTLLISANNCLTQLERDSKYIPDVKLFVSMYVRKEALLSSQIEGTQATLEDILDPLIDENTNRNIEDVVNHIRATEYGVTHLDELPICNRLIKKIHEILMENVRGQEKTPGQFRYTQNWIGGAGSTIRNARYIPPNPEDMINAMSDLEKFINEEDDMQQLIRIALIHYQFETIHPFLDGNGRIGRLLITLYLMDKKILTSPSLYISCYLKQNRTEYYDRISEVRRTGDYEQWIKFFLRAIIESGKDAIQSIEQLTILHNKNINILKNRYSTRQFKNASLLYSYLETNPIIEITKTAKMLDVSYNTVASLVSGFCECRILAEEAKRGKSHVYTYSDYLNILRKDT